MAVCIHGVYACVSILIAGWKSEFENNAQQQHIWYHPIVSELFVTK